MRARSVVLALLVALSAITYMDRVCISHAGTRMQHDLGLGKAEWGWVLAVFSIGYGLFEIPTGAWGDRIGQRRILTRIVLWWSVFTMLTGAAWGFVSLVTVRFLFSIGEAGAYPNAAGSVGRWFPVTERAWAQGAIWGASRVGGAVTPLVVLPLIANLGWRTTFVLFGTMGVVWAIVWRVWYRDHPAEHPSVTPEELAEIGPPSRHSVDNRDLWRLAASGRIWLIMAMYFCYAWGPAFFLGWFPEYLRLGLGFVEHELAICAAVPFIAGAFGNLAGGFLSDRLTRSHGRNIGRRVLGGGCLLAAAGLVVATALTPDRYVAVGLLALCFGIIDCMLPCAWAICLDVGGDHAGAVSGAMNSAGQAGVFFCTVLFGYLIEWYGNYQLPLYAIGGMVLVSGILFLLIDPTRPLLALDSAKEMDAAS
jgi:MFS transporter, ACS family, glucarate transporter